MLSIDCDVLSVGFLGAAVASPGPWRARRRRDSAQVIDALKVKGGGITQDGVRLAKKPRRRY
jgi:hypothetical protein